ncbi:MAG: MFS transporter permease [Alphaproteobacteria bacterium]
MVRDVGETLYDVLTGDESARACRDLPEEACRHRARNFFIHVASLALTKAGDGLADARLVLPWLLGAVGAPAAAIGFLVPVREALALLPQLAFSAEVRALPRRKGVWAAASVAQGACVLAMAAVVTTLEGAAAGWSVVALLALFALARSAASVSQKDVLAKTVDKQRRGSATGLAGSVGAAVVLAFGAGLAAGVIPLTVTAVTLGLVAAGLGWLAAGLAFLALVEEPGATEGGANGFAAMAGQLGLLRRDADLRRLVAVRGLALATALAPPFLLARAGGDDGRALGELGLFVVAGGVATMASSPIWGRFADRSSRRVFIAAALAGAGAIALAAVAPPAVLPGLLFGLLVAHQGLRLARKIHLTDMAPADDRPAYTAVANTATGVLLLAGGGFGLVADAFGPAVVLALLAVMAAAAAGLAAGLREVQG